jgi:hypothetical protein
MPTRREVLQTIVTDCEDDVARMEGRPFTGKVVCETFAELYATVQALAKIVLSLLPEEEADV